MDPLLEKLQQTLRAAAEGMTADELRWHPEGKWCAAEILEHLYLSYTGTIKGFERVLGSGKPTITEPTLTQRFGTFVVLRFNYLPEGRKAPKNTQPRGLPAERVRAEAEEKIAEMDAAIEACEEKLGRGKLLDHPILGPLTGAQWRKFHLLHGRHHGKQIRKLRQESAVRG